MRAIALGFCLLFVFVLSIAEAQASDLGVGRSLFFENEIFDATDDVTFELETPRRINRPSGKRVNLSLYTRNRVAFRAYCDALHIDGRRDDFAAFLDLAKFERESCVACPTFFRIVQTACRPPLARASVASAELSAPARQREPHPEVINATLQLSRLLQADEATTRETAIVVSLMNDTLRQSHELSPGLKDYLSALFELWLNPFREQIAEIKREREASQAEPEIRLRGGGRSQQLESLFDF